MHVTPTNLPGVLLISPKVYNDKRGYFFESFNQQRFNDLTQTQHQFVQDNQSCSEQGVLRGLHYQLQQPQGKLVRVLSGEIYDVAVDIRPGSSHFGCWTAATLSAENNQQLWVPPGFAHGFLVLSNSAVVAYKTTDYYAPQYERSIYYNDPALNITWPKVPNLTLSDKDQNAKFLTEAEL